MCVTVFAFFTYLLTVGGYYSYKIKEWYNSAPAERALGSLDPPACSSRPRLKAPAEWIHGERLAQVEHIVGDGVRLCPLEVERPAKASTARGASLAHPLAVDEEAWRALISFFVCFVLFFS